MRQKFSLPAILPVCSLNEDREVDVAPSLGAVPSIDQRFFRSIFGSRRHPRPRARRGERHASIQTKTAACSAGGGVDSSGGESGIRTHGTLLRFTSLAKKRFRPLSHLARGKEKAGPGRGRGYPGRTERNQSLGISSTSFGGGKTVRSWAAWRRAPASGPVPWPSMVRLVQ